MTTTAREHLDDLVEQLAQRGIEAQPHHLEPTRSEAIISGSLLVVGVEIKRDGLDQWYIADGKFVVGAIIVPWPGVMARMIELHHWQRTQPHEQQ